MDSFAPSQAPTQGRPGVGRRRSTKYSRLLSVGLIAALGVFSLSFLWPYQRFEPVLTGIFCAACYFLGFALTDAATTRYKSFAVTAFSIKFCSAYVILVYGWFNSADCSRDSVENVFDPVIYDTYAAWIAQSGHSLAYFADPGAMGNYPYIIKLYSLIYGLAGASVINAAAFNSMLVAVAYYFFRKVAKLLGGDQNVEKFLICVYLIPEILYLTAMPGKEATSLALAGAVTFLVLAWPLNGRIGKRDGLLALVTVGALLLIKIQVFVAAAVVTCFLRFSSRPSCKRPLLLCSVLLGVTIAMGAMLSQLPLPDSVRQLVGSGLVFSEEGVNEVEQRYADAGVVMLQDNSLTASFIPFTILQSLYFTPLRVGCYLITPFPPTKALPPLRHLDRAEIGDLYPTACSFMGVFGLLTVGIMFGPLLDRAVTVTGVKTDDWKAFFWVLGTLAFISFSAFIIHERYRVYGLPMWLISLYFGMRNRLKWRMFLGNAVLGVILTVLFLWIKE